MFFATFGFLRVCVVIVRIVGLALMVVLFRSRMRGRQGADQQVVLLSILYRDDDFIIGSFRFQRFRSVNVDTLCFFSGAARLPVDGEADFCPDNGSSIGRPRQADRKGSVVQRSVDFIQSRSQRSAYGLRAFARSAFGVADVLIAFGSNRRELG